MLGQQNVGGCASIDINHVSCRYNASLFQCHGVPDLSIRHTVEWHEITPPGLQKHLEYLHFSCRRCTLIFYFCDTVLARRQSKLQLSPQLRLLFDDSQLFRSLDLHFNCQA